MPYTPYHFGPSALIGFLLRKWVDIPVFVLANLAIDLEILVVEILRPKHFVPRYAHTLMLGTVVGIIWGVVAHFFKGVFRWVMEKIQLPYKTSMSKMIVSAIFGAWVHVLIDGLYRSDVRLFWPSKLTNPLARFSKGEVGFLCVMCFIAAFVVYVWILAKKPKKAPAHKGEK